jgi:hypothetical protein
MEAVEFLDLAEILGSEGGPFPEARHRTAISRSYYAALLAARDKLADERGWVFRARETHEFVRRAYAFADPTRHKLIGRLLADLKKLREQADYENRNPLGDVTEAISLSKQVCTELSDADAGDCVDPRRG